MADQSVLESPSLFGPPTPHEQQLHDFVCGIWGFSHAGQIPLEDAAQLVHHLDCLVADTQLLDQNDSLFSDVTALVSHLKQHSQSSIADIRASLQLKPNWRLRNSNDPDVSDRVLQFCARLFLFCKLDLSNASATLEEAARESLNRIKGQNDSRLRFDFCVQTLAKRGRLEITPTTDISEHLTLDSESKIRVFIHTNVLKHYESAPERQYYPLGLLMEIRKTLDLLWPIEDMSGAKHVKRLQPNKETEVETAVLSDDRFDVRLYPFFGRRLARIQDRLEAEEARRRKAFGLRIALCGIVLLAITSIIQVWASFRT